MKQPIYGFKTNSFFYIRHILTLGIIEMYPYHNKIKQRIKNNELLKYEYVDKYKDINPCLLLYFSTDPKIRPIREHRFDEYEKMFAELFEK